MRVELREKVATFGQSMEGKFKTGKDQESMIGARA